MQIHCYYKRKGHSCYVVKNILTPHEIYTTFYYFTIKQKLACVLQYSQHMTSQKNNNTETTLVKTISCESIELSTPHGAYSDKTTVK